MNQNTELQIDLQGPLDSLSLSPNQKFVAVGGREVFKIVSIDLQKGFSEKLNLKKGKYGQLNKTIVDIRWHHKLQNLIASAPTNGSVVIWDVTQSQGTMKHVYSEHTRTVNEISWKPDDNNTLISGSQDGEIKVWDIRVPESTITLSILNTEVRCVSFSPFYQYYFAAGYETGVIEIWDIRKGKNDQSIRKINCAHNGLIHTIDWHPTKKNEVASGGRDMCLRVWDLTKNDIPRKTVQTFATVASIAWRPNFTNEIASSSSVIDNSAYIWDLEMPFIPKYNIENHKDVITDLTWFNNESQYLLTCSKDYFLSLHEVNHSKKPQKNIRKTTTSWNVNNNLAMVSMDQLSKNSLSSNFEQQFIQIMSTSSSLNFEQQEDEEISNLKYFSKHFNIFGDESIQQKCLHNASICSKKNQFELKSIWLTLSSIEFKDLENKENKDEELKETIIKHSLSQFQEDDDDDDDLPKTIGIDSPIGMESYNNSPKLKLNFPPTIEISVIKEKEIFDETLILNLLDHFSENGNIQMCFFISFIFKSKISMCNERIQEFQYYYLEILKRMKLFDKVSEILKYTTKKTIHSQIILACGSCGKKIENEKCKQYYR
eukprot:gene1065-10584_t